MIRLFIILTASTLSAKGALNTTDIYETLYAQHGYHSNLKLSRSAGLLELIRPVADAFDRPVLDVGCSHGLAVEALWKWGVPAVGVDIAPYAIRMAKKYRTSTMPLCGEGEPECFQVASATNLPFPDKSVDAIISTDVLEHLLPEEAPLMVKEFLRVTRRIIFLQIATSNEANKRPIRTLKENNDSKFANLTTLHTTVWPIRKWSKLFADARFDHQKPHVFLSENKLVIWV